MVSEGLGVPEVSGGVPEVAIRGCQRVTVWPSVGSSHAEPRRHDDEHDGRRPTRG